MYSLQNTQCLNSLGVMLYMNKYCVQLAILKPFVKRLHFIINKISVSKF